RCYFWCYLSTENGRNRAKLPASTYLTKGLVPQGVPRFCRVGTHASESSSGGLTSRGSLVRSQYRPLRRSGRVGVEFSPPAATLSGGGSKADSTADGASVVRLRRWAAAQSVTRAVRVALRHAVEV